MWYLIDQTTAPAPENNIPNSRLGSGSIMLWDAFFLFVLAGTGKIVRVDR